MGGVGVWGCFVRCTKKQVGALFFLVAYKFFLVALEFFLVAYLFFRVPDERW